MPKRRQGARRSDFGRLLADLRMAKGLSLRRVEEVTRNTVSNSYLSQLESGKIHKPSPNVLRSLAAVLCRSLRDADGESRLPAVVRRRFSGGEEAGSVRDRRCHRRGRGTAPQVPRVSPLALARS